MRFAPPPPQRSATAVYVTLLAQLVATAGLVIFELVRGRRLAVELAAVGGDPDAPGARAVLGAVSVFAVLVLLLTAATFTAAACYAAWLLRAAQAADPSGRMTGLILAGWLVPLVNLAAPPLIVDRVWRAAGPPSAGRRGWLVLLYGWWASTLATLALVLLKPSATGPDPAGLTGLALPELASATIAAALCAATVREITNLRQPIPHASAPRSPAPPPVPEEAARMSA